MKSYIEVANETCRINAYKHKYLNFSAKSLGRKRTWFYTAKKGLLIHKGFLNEISKAVGVTESGFKSAFYERGRIKGFTLTREKRETL